MNQTQTYFRQRAKYKSNLISTICTDQHAPLQQWTLLSLEFKSFDDKRFYELNFERLKFAEGFLKIQIVSNDDVYVSFTDTIISSINK